jgi:mannonate dehydratase
MPRRTRIAEVTVHLVAKYAFVRIRTEDGSEGVGQSGNFGFPQVTGGMLEPLRDVLIGQDPDEIGRLSLELFRAVSVRGQALTSTIGAIDLALWDLKGRHFGAPVWQLLGGRCRTAVPLYAHAAGRDAEEVADEVRDLMSQGYRYVRCQVAVPGAGTYGAPAARAPAGSRPSLTPNAWDPAAYRRTVRRLFEHLRQEVGEDVELIHDVHERVHPTDAVRIAKDLEPYDLFYLEDPVAPEDLEWLRILRSRSVTPVAIGELFTNPAEYRPVVQDRLCDFIRVHISAVGGITPAWRLAGA